MIPPRQQIEGGLVRVSPTGLHGFPISIASENIGYQLSAAISSKQIDHAVKIVKGFLEDSGSRLLR
jgi:hypothetical protein